MTLSNQKKENRTNTKIKSILRIRPLLKKERDDHVALEPFECGTAVALHPPLVKDSAETTFVQTGRDVELRFDRVFAATASQDKIYAAVGQPMALQAMEPLKTDGQGAAAETTHLIIGMGLAASGTTYSCMGSQHVSKRKSDSDGLVPRILDSLYSQATHNRIAEGHKNVSFAVKLVILQVNQSKTNASDCRIYDLLQPVPKVSSSAVETLGSGINSFASTILNSMDLANGSMSTSKIRNINYAALNEPVKVQQDLSTAECFLVNSTTQTCYSQDDARETLQKALTHSRQLTHKKCQSHVLVQIQPVLMSTRSGRTVRTGETMAVLDMASCDAAKQRAARLREPNRADAHTAVMHCLKAIQYNEAISLGRDERLLDDEESSHRGNHDKRKMQRKRSLRKVPFLQHQVTMLLQPLFHGAHTFVTLLVTVSPSNRDYSEKKLLLTELVALHIPAPNTAVSTCVVAAKVLSTAQNKGEITKVKEQKKVTHPRAASDADDDASMDRSCNSKKKNADSAYDSGLMLSPNRFERVHSMTYSEDSKAAAKGYSDRFLPLPPPVAPGYKDNDTSSTQAMKRRTFSPQASAPMEEPPVPPPIMIVGCVLEPLLSTQSASLTEISSSSTVKSEARGNKQGAVPIDTGEESPEPKFSYMKTINKVVHASKKKGRKVMERMTVTTISSDHQLQQHVADLEEQNAALIRANASLHEKNRQLQQRVNELSEEKSKEQNLGDRDGSQAQKFDTSLSENNGINRCSPSYKKRIEKAKKTLRAQCNVSDSVALKDVVTNDDSASLGTTFSEPVSSKAPDQMYDNPLFRHMATMNNQSTARFTPTSTNASNTHSYQRTYDLQDGDSISRGSNEENSPKTNELEYGPNAFFDDPLLRHMAMMNTMQ